jgi:hypothetical protein
LIRCFLEAGVMLNGVIMERHEGTPQGGRNQTAHTKLPTRFVDEQGVPRLAP